MKRQIQKNKMNLKIKLKFKMQLVKEEKLYMILEVTFIYISYINYNI